MLQFRDIWDFPSVYLRLFTFDVHFTNLTDSIKTIRFESFIIIRSGFCMSNIERFIWGHIFDFIRWFPFRAYYLLFDCEIRLFSNVVMFSKITSIVTIISNNTQRLQITFPNIPSTPVFIFCRSMAMGTRCIVKWSSIFGLFILKYFALVLWISFIPLDFKCRCDKCNQFISFIIEVILKLRFSRFYKSLWPQKILSKGHYP